MPTKNQQRYYDSRRKLTHEQHATAYDMYHNAPSMHARPTIDRLAQLFNVSHYTMWRVIHTPPSNPTLINPSD